MSTWSRICEIAYFKASDVRKKTDMLNAADWNKQKRILRILQSYNCVLKMYEL